MRKSTQLITFLLFLILQLDACGKQITPLTIVAPIDIKKHAYIEDGGTLSLDCSDAKGHKFSFCFDGRSRSKTSGRIYFGCQYINNKTSRMLPEDSKEEKIIIALLHQWIDKRFTLREQKELSKGKKKPTETEIRAMRILGAIQCQENVKNLIRWLDNNYTKEEQNWFLKRDSNKGLNKKQSTVWHYIHSLHGYEHSKR